MIPTKFRSLALTHAALAQTKQAKTVRNDKRLRDFACGASEGGLQALAGVNNASSNGWDGRTFDASDMMHHASQVPHFPC